MAQPENRARRGKINAISRKTRRETDMGIPTKLRSESTHKRTNAERRRNIHEKCERSNEGMGKLGKNNSQIPPEHELPKIQHVSEIQWGQIRTRMYENNKDAHRNSKRA